MAAFNVSKSGGIHIEVDADLAKLSGGLAEARKLANDAANSISASMSGALTPKGVTTAINSITTAFSGVQQAAKGLKVDLSQYNSLFTNIGKAIGVAENDLNKFANTQQRALQNRLVKEYEQSVGKLERVMNQTGSNQSLYKRFNSDASAAYSLSGAIQKLKYAVAGYVGFDMLRDVARTSVDMASLQKTFFALTGSMEGARGEISWLREEAQRLGLDFFALTESFKGFSAAGLAAGMSTEQTRDIFTSVSEAATVLGLNSEKTKLALYALEQMLSKGTVSMEELRRQLGDQLPGAFQMAARAMGVTTMELSDMVKSGKLLSEDFLPKFARVLREQYGPGLEEAMKTPRAEIQRLTNAIALAKVEIGEGGFLKGISEAARQLSYDLQTDEMRAQLNQLGQSLGYVTGNLAEVLSFGVRNSQAILSLTAGFAAAKGAALLFGPAIKAVNFELATMPSLMAGVRSGAKSMGTTLLSAFGGPVGLGVTALTAGVVYLATRQKESVDVAVKYADAFKAITGNAAEAADAMGSLRADIETLSKTARESAIKALEEDIARVTKEVEAFYMRVLPLPRELEDLGYAFEDSASQVNDAIEAFKSGKIPLEAFKEAVRSLHVQGMITTARMGELFEVADKFAALRIKRGLFDEITESAETAGDAIEKALKLDTEKLTKSIDEYRFKISQLTRGAAEQVSAKALVDIGINYADIDKFGLVSEEAWVKYNLGAGEAAQKTRAQIEELQWLTQEFRGAELITKAVEKAQEDARKGVDKAIDSLEKFEKEYRKTVQGASGQIESIIKSMEDYREAAVTAFTAGRTSAEDFAAQLERIQELQNKLVGKELAKNPLWEELDKLQEKLALGEGGFGDAITAGLGRLVEDYQNAFVSLKEISGDFFETFTQGFSDSIGRAIIYGDSLKESLQNVAQQALASVISGLVQVGIQMAVNAALGQSISAAAQAAAATEAAVTGAAIAAAYAPAAAAVSLASYGANAAPAMAGMTATYSLAEALSLASGFKTGGFTGTGNPNDPAGIVHKGEFVIPAAAVSQIGLPALESLARGGSIDPFIFDSMPAQWADRAAQPVQMKVSVENYGSAKDFEVQQVSADEVRIIARDVMRRESPSLFASNLRNPNSLESKALGRNTNAGRRR